MNDDLTLVALGRAFVELAIQRENLIRSNMQLSSQLEQMKEANKPPKE